MWAALCIAGSPAALAATAACPTATTTTNPLDTQLHTDNTAVTIAAAGSVTATSDNSLSNLNAYSGAANFDTGGCLATEISFNNFRVTATGSDSYLVFGAGTEATDIAGQPTEANIYGAFSPVTNGSQLLMTSIRGSANNTSNTDVNDGALNFYDTGSPGTNANAVFNFLFTVSAPSGKWLTSGNVSLNYYNFTSDADNTLQIFICGDYTTTTVQTTAFTDCGVIGGTLVTTSISLSNSFSNTDTLTQFLNTGLSGYSNAYVDVRLSMDGRNNSPNTANNTNSYVFGIGTAFTAETPEPSTFAMLGTALVGLGVLARRRKRQ